MEINNPNLEMLKVAVKKLEPLSDRLVFVGGATIGLYIDSKAVEEVRPTEDVDCIIEITTRVEFVKLEAELRKLGLKNETKKGAPICRWVFDGITVDIMPTDEKILGFSNRWYVDGIQNKKSVKVGDQEIFILSLPYFLACKLEAFLDRGAHDPRFSKDLEDIVFVLNGMANPMSEMINVSKELKNYFSKELLKCLKDDVFQEAIEGFLRAEGASRISRVKELLEKIAKL